MCDLYYLFMSTEFVGYVQDSRFDAFNSSEVKLNAIT